jgi:hypothetical protein
MRKSHIKMNKGTKGEGERNGAPKSNVLMSPVANPKSGPDYSVFITKYIYIYIF